MKLRAFLEPFIFSTGKECEQIFLFRSKNDRTYCRDFQKINKKRQFEKKKRVKNKSMLSLRLWDGFGNSEGNLDMTTPETSYEAVSAALFFRCVKKEAASVEDHSVDDALCDQDEMPPRAQVCFLACPNACVMAPWGPWSNCPEVNKIKSNFLLLFAAVLLSHRITEHRSAFLGKLL